MLKTSAKLSDKPINVALIGCGYWGRNLARVINANPDCALVAAVDKDENHLNAVGQLYPHIQKYSSYEQLAAHKKVDAVVIATPVATHFKIASFFLEQKIHVLCEKVLCPNYEQGKQLYDIAFNSNTTLMVGHTFLYNSIVNSIKEAIDAGDFGEILYLTFKRTGLGPIRKDVDVVYDLASHDISILTHWLGKPESVAATKRCMGNGPADIAFLHIKYPNGIIADIQVSWISPMKQRQVEVVGTKQMIMFDDVSTTEKLRIIKTGKSYQSLVDDFGSFQLSVKDGDIIIPSILYPEPLKEEIAFFVHCITNGVWPEENLNCALNVIQIVENMVEPAFVSLTANT